jgi:topoisomerase-4 subunit A
LGIATLFHHPTLYVRFNKKFKQAQHKTDESVNLRDFIAVKGLKAIGNRLTTLPVLNVELLEADPVRENESENLLQEMIRAKRPQVKVQLDRPDDSIGTDTSEGIDEPQRKGKAAGPGKQESLF